MKKMKPSWFLFEPEKSFLELLVVRRVISFLVFIALIFFLIISVNTPSQAQWNADGFNGFLSIYKFPLGILALIIPIVALLAANHRSEQTRAQLEVNQQQNLFSNFYKHIEEFEKYTDRHLDPQYIVSRLTYEALFPASREGHYTVAEEVVKKIEGSFERIIDQASQEDIVSSLELRVKNIETEINAISSLLNIKEKGKRGTGHNIDGVTVTFENDSTVSYMETVIERAAMIQQLILFDSRVKAPQSLETVANLQKKDLANWTFSHERKNNRKPVLF